MVRILLWAKTQVNFVIKWKIFIYLSKSVSSPSKWSSTDIMHLCQRFFQSSKHLLNSISRIAFKAFFDSACISLIVSKRRPRSGLLSLGNNQKTHGAKSGDMVVVKRYALSFWGNGHEERVQRKTAHYRDAKTTSCLPKISF